MFVREGGAALLEGPSSGGYRRVEQLSPKRFKTISTSGQACKAQNEQHKGYVERWVRKLNGNLAASLGASAVLQTCELLSVPKVPWRPVQTRPAGSYRTRPRACSKQQTAMCANNFEIKACDSNRNVHFAGSALKYFIPLCNHYFGSCFSESSSPAAILSASLRSPWGKARLDLRLLLGIEDEDGCPRPSSVSSWGGWSVTWARNRAIASSSSSAHLACLPGWRAASAAAVLG